jgi:hypothetical protein
MKSKIQEYMHIENIKDEIVPLDVFYSDQVKFPKIDRQHLERNILDSISISLFKYESNQIEVFYKPISRAMDPDKIIKL